MWSVFDVNGFVDEIGSISTVNGLYDMTKRFGLENLKSFFDQGFSVNINGMRSDLEELDFGFSELNEVKDDFLFVINSCEEIVILSDGTG